MKYITVTLNPTVDRTYSLDSPISLGNINRCCEMSKCSYSGKGINVSRELFRLGVDSKMVCILRGEEGKKAFYSMTGEDLNVHAVIADGRMRHNVSFIDPNGVGTDINEAGDELDIDSIVKFFALYDKLISETGQKTVILSGSTPPGFRLDIYKMLSINARKKGAYVILDADKELLINGLEGHPNLIKPNENELFALTGWKLSGDEGQKRISALAAASVIYEKSGIEVLCTLGESGSVYVGKEGQFACPARKTSVKRTKGAGDMYLARFIYERFEKHRSIADAMRTASEKTARNLSI